MQQSERVIHKDRMISDRIRRHKEFKELEHFVSVEKRNLMKLNQIEKTREDEFFSQKKKQNLYSKLYEPNLSLKSPSAKQSAQILQESIASTKFNSNKIIASIRSCLLYTSDAADE